jgi:hypothetical protein
VIVAAKICPVSPSKFSAKIPGKFARVLRIG